MNKQNTSTTKKRFIVQEGTPYNQKIGGFDLTGQTFRTNISWEIGNENRS